MKVAVIFHRLGPYHFARLRAAGKLLAVTAIETSGADETYAWDLIAGADGFERVTLFGNADAQRQPAIEVAGRVGSALEKILPAVVAIPGWSDAAALAALQWCSRKQVPAIVMSESTERDEARRVWREAVKRRIVGLFSAALVGGRPHKDYMVKLGMPAERVFLGYDAVDNGYFAAGAAKWQKLKAEIRNHKSAGNIEHSTFNIQHPTEGKADDGQRMPDDGCLKTDTRCQTTDGVAESRNQKSEIKNGFQFSAFQLSAFKNAPYFLASARFIEKKNLPRLIQAYALYREKAETLKTENLKAESEKSDVRCQTSALWSLVLLGDGALRSDLCRLISDLRLQHCVLLPGFKQYPDLPAYYGLANAFIHASTTEQWGLVVNEAMASGLPVLVSNRCGCAADLVQEGVNGFTFDPCNVEEIAQLMLKISAFNFPLSAFGSESQRIISHWGSERFAFGLKQAAECAPKVGSKRASLPDRLLLAATMRP